MKDEAKLKAIKYISAVYADEKELKNLDTSVSIDCVPEVAAYLVKATTKIFGEELVDQKYEHPAGWWQYFKRDYLPTLAKFFPVKYKFVTIKAAALYPHVSMPDKAKYDQRVVDVGMGFMEEE